LKVQEAQIVGGLLFPADEEAAGAVGPGMGPFDDPTPGLAIAMLSRWGVVILLGDVGNVVTLAGGCADSISIVSFVATQMLLLMGRGLGAADGNALQGLSH